MADKWYVVQAGRTDGPFDAMHLRKLLAEGKLAPTAKAARPGDAQWRPVTHVLALAEAGELAAPAPALAEAEEWFFALGGKPQGPIGRAEALERLRDGRIQPQTPMARRGDPHWRPASEALGLLRQG